MTRQRGQAVCLQPKGKASACPPSPPLRSDLKEPMRSEAAVRMPSSSITWGRIRGDQGHRVREQSTFTTWTIVRRSGCPLSPSIASTSRPGAASSQLQLTASSADSCGRDSAWGLQLPCDVTSISRPVAASWYSDAISISRT